MTALSSRRRQRTWMMFAVTAVVIVLGVVLLVTGTDAIRQYTAAKRADAGLPVVAVPKTPTAMFATVDGENRLTSVTMFVLAPSLAGGSIVSVPANVDSTQGVGDERLTLIGAYAQDGATGLVQAVEATLSLSVDYWAVDDPAKAAGVLQPVGKVAVDLPRTVVGGDGSSSVLFERGEQSLDASEAVQVLTATSTTVDEAGRTPNIEAIWQGVATSVGAGVAGQSPSSPTVGSFEDVVAHLFAGPVGSRGLPVSAFAPGTAGVEGNDVALLDRAEQLMVFASIAPGSMSRPADGLAVSIVAPPGSEARVKDAISILLYSGDNIAAVDLTGTPRDRTEVLVYDDAAKPSMESLRDYFGDFAYGTPTSQPDGVEATIELGADFLNSTEVASTPETTTTTLVGS
ncbi:MAG: hypothetical protein QM733_20700 [Ilumatobacteraceae bacterium]